MTAAFRVTLVGDVDGALALSSGEREGQNPVLDIDGEVVDGSRLGDSWDVSAWGERRPSRGPLVWRSRGRVGLSRFLSFACRGLRCPRRGDTAAALLR